MLAFLSAVAYAAILAAGPPDDAPTETRQQFERLQGFSTVVINHVGEVLGTDKLPNALGLPVEPGVFSTVTLDKVQIYDRDVAGLQQGRTSDTTAATECVSGCPSVFYDAFQQAWLEAAIEATLHTVEIPSRVLFAAHHDLPAATLVQLAYAAAETRPVQPPSLHILVNSSQGGLRASPFFLVPPDGLELRQGSAALGLTVSMSPGRYVITATDPRFAREHVAKNAEELRRLLADIKKRYPGKESVIIVPEGNLTVGEMMRSFAVIQAWFPRMVLSGGQRVRTP